MFKSTKNATKNAIDNKVLGLSIVSVLMAAIFLNEWIVKSQYSVGSITESSRGIASFEDHDSVDGVKWEHELAQKLAQEKQTAKSLLAVKPTLKDELVFGLLEGKYKTNMVNAKIESFDFSDTQAGDQPLEIKERAEFLKIFRSVFSLGYAKVQLEKRENSQEIYKLLSASNKDLGQARFELDEQGRVLSLKFIQ